MPLLLRQLEAELEYKMTPFTEAELKDMQYAISKLDVENDISLVLEVQDYGRFLIGVVIELQNHKTALELQRSDLLSLHQASLEQQRNDFKDEIDWLQVDNTDLRLQLAEAELKLSTVIPDMAKRIAMLEQIGKDNHHKLLDIKSIAKEMI